MSYARKFAAALAASVCIVAVAAPASAQTRDYDIPAGSLKTALDAYARQSGRQVIYKVDEVRSARSPGAKGSLSADAALHALLAGTGFTARSDASGAIAIVRSGPHDQTSAVEDENEAETNVSLTNRSDILVVGSRLGTKSPAESVLPIRVLTREDIDRSGSGTIAQALSYLPEVSVNNGGDTSIGAVAGLPSGRNPINATTVQLRGLPAGTTLILINGRRAGESSAFQASGQFDLSTIPLSMVERIEVLPAGASAIYGGDALAGVVNIVLKRNANGFEANGRHSFADGYSESNASVLWGRSWSGGQFTVGANWRRTGQLTTSERPLTADQDYTRFGGDDYRSAFGYPGNIYSLAGCPPAPDLCFSSPSTRGNLPGLNSPIASVPGGQNGKGLTPAAFVPTAGKLNTSSDEYNLFSPGESYGLNFNGSIDVTDNVELFAEFAFSRRDVPAVVAPFVIQFGQYGYPSARVPASNPFNPFGVDVGVNFRFPDTGVIQDFSQEHWRAVVGARGNVGRWTWELTGSQSRDKSSITRTGNVFDMDKVTAALQSTNPATALNPFVGDGSAPWSDAVFQTLLTPAQSANAVTRQQDVTGTLRGPLLRLPAGDVLLVVGGEYQRLTLKSEALLTDSATDTSWASFAEVRVPLWKREGDARERLAATGAWRRETSDRFEGAANTWTGGLEFRPWQTLLLRGTYSTSFKPLVVFNALRPTTGFPSYAQDPKFNNQIFPVEYASGGGVPDGLKPETGTSKTLGLVWSPSSRFRSSVTWWDNQLRNRFTIPSPPFLIANEALFPGRVVRDPGSGFLTKIDIRPINIANTHVSGVDFAIDGRWSTGIGDFIPSLAATYTIQYREQILPTTPVQNNLGVLRYTGWSPRWKVVPRLGWDYQGIVYANVGARYVSSYRDPEPLYTGPNAGTELILGDFVLVDFNMDLNIGRWLAPKSSLLAGTRLSFGVNNLFDKGPEFCNSCGSGGYDASQYDILGRNAHLALRMSF